MSYNPFKSALTAAIAELTSPAAKRYYSRRSQQDAQTVLILVFELACMAFELGAQCRQLVNALEESAQAQPAAPGAIVPAQSAALVAPIQVAIASAAPAALTGFTPAALLNEAPKPKRTRKPAQKTAPKAPRKPAQKSPKAPGVDRRKEPTRARCGGKMICID